MTSYTDSVASHSQSGYPNRKVHVFLFLKLVLKKRNLAKTNKKHPTMKLEQLDSACYRGLLSRGEQWLRHILGVDE